MVFFCCNTCGGSFKKNQVDKHKFQCRCSSLSCMDCQKDFSRDDYTTHTKCVSEEQKYAAQGWQAPENRNKGEKKQMAWVEIVQDTVRKAGATLKPAAKTLLHHLTKHENVPRKKPKFFNFVANVGKNRFDQDTVGLVWDLLETEWKASAPAAASEPKKTEPVPQPAVVAAPAVEDNSQEKKKKKKKKDKKKDEENEGLIEATEDSAIIEEAVKEDKQKKKKRKRDELESEVNGAHEVPDSVVVEEPPKKKKKKKKDKDQEAPEVNGAAVTNGDSGPADSTTNFDAPSQESEEKEKKKKKKKNKQQNGDYALLEQSVTENDDSLIMAVDEGAKKKKKKSKKNKESLLE